MRDNTTGLIWQTHTVWGTTDLRSAGKQFTNYTSTTLAQKVNTSTTTPTPVMIPPTQADIDATTNAQGFRRQVNAEKLCGSAAWRLPTESELKHLAMSSALHAEWLTYSRGRDYWSSTEMPKAYSYFSMVNISSGIALGTYGLGTRFEIKSNVILVHN